MSAPFSRKCAALFLLSCPLTALMLGGGCPPVGVPLPGGGPVIVEPVPDFITVELVNETPFDVDPGVFLNGVLLDTGLLAPAGIPGDLVTFDVDCFPGDILEVDGILFLSPVDQVLSVNVPFLEEGFEFLCGDIITLFYTQDVTGQFFIDVAVNDVLLPLP